MPTPNPEISLVIPLLDERGSLPELADRIRAALEPTGRTYEVWLVDDGSTDGSWEAIEALHRADPRFAGVRLRRNYGKSAALAVGFERARGRYVATLDADLQDDPMEIPAMIERLEAGADLVSGWKRKRQDPLSKRLPSKFFNGVTRVVSGIPLHDFNCGLKAYRAEVVKHVRVYGELHRYIPLLAKWEGYTRIAEQPVKHHPRKHGRTKFGLERFVRGFLDLLTVVFVTRFGRRPMHFFGGMGTAAFIGGFAILAYLTVLWFTGQPIGGRPLFFLGITLLIVGTQLFLTGFLGEMIVRPEMEETAAIHVRDALEPHAAAVEPMRRARVAEVVEPGA
ncbi:MAG: glycosyltransferase family 2 protein [Rhodothermales bacterium]|nr:glycosyltransferase family 2 protein [Rhodothermales bacterium]